MGKLVQARTRRIVALSLGLFIGGALLVLIGCVPPVWLDQIIAGIQMSVNVVSALDWHILIVGLGGIVMLGGVLTFATMMVRMLLEQRALERLKQQQTLLEPDVAPVSAVVYIDLENQRPAKIHISDFIAFINAELNQRSADVFFFADTTYESSIIMSQLTAVGFQFINVPHFVPKNMVDAVLSYEAYTRAISVGREQEVILVLADRDYVPLIKTLREQGIRVSIWGRNISHQIKNLEKSLQVVVIEYNSGFTQKLPSS